MERVKKPIPESETPVRESKDCSSGVETGRWLCVGTSPLHPTPRQRLLSLFSGWSWPEPPVSIPQGRPTPVTICIAEYAYVPSYRPQGSTQLKTSSQPLARLGTPSLPSYPGDTSQPPAWVWLCVPMQLGGGCGDHSWPQLCLVTLPLPEHCLQKAPWNTIFSPLHHIAPTGGSSRGWC